MKKPELVVLGIDGGIDSYIAEAVGRGELPNFARMLKKSCRMTDLRTVHPTITPVCWSAFLTGATPEVNGIVSDTMHLHGSIDNRVSGYHGEYLLAERFYETAAKAGKTTFVDSMPVSAPVRSDKVIQIEGTSCFPGRLIKNDGSQEYSDIPQQIWYFDLNMKPVEKLSGFRVNSSPIKETDKNVFELEADFSEKGCNYRNVPHFNWRFEWNDEIIIASETENFSLEIGKWIIIRRRLANSNGNYLYSFYCGLFRYSTGYALFISADCDIRDRVFPVEKRKLLDNLPPTPVGREYMFVWEKETAHLAFDSWHFQNDYHMELLRRVMNDGGTDIIIHYLGETDTINHIFMSELSGAQPCSAERKEFAEWCYRMIYEEYDRYLGFILDEIADENTTILIVSDHGGIGVTEERNINDVLEKNGLLYWIDKTKNIIDVSKTKALCTGCCNIHINLKGREENGIVPADEYDKTVSEIISLLQENLRSPENEPYLAFAVRRSEAGFFGLDSERCGDVVFGLSGGYAASTIHAEQIPTACNSFGTIRSLGIICGPGIANGVYDKCVNITDLAPTLCAGLGIDVPADSNGRVIRRICPHKH